MDRREYVEWLLTFEKIGLVPVDSTTKKPKSCSLHPECACFSNGYKSPTRDADGILRALELHPEKILGACPLPGLVVLDFDSKDAVESFCTATGTDLNSHLAVATSRGIHLYLSVEPGELRAPLKHHEVDVMIPLKGMAIAPGSVRSDGGRYQIISGMWGHPAESLDAVAYFTRRPTKSVELPHIRRGPRSARSRVAGRRRAAHKIRTLDKLRRSDKAGSGPELRQRDDQSQSGDLCSMWLYCFWAGLDCHEAVELVRLLNPSSVSRRLDSSGFTPLWLEKDAERVYTKATDNEHRPRYAASRTRNDLLREFGDNHRTVQVLDYIVNKINLTLSPKINVGCQELADEFGVTKKTGALWLRLLVELGALRKTRDAVWTRDPGVARLVAQYEVVGIDRDRSQDCVKPGDTAGTALKPESVTAKEMVNMGNPSDSAISTDSSFGITELLRAQIHEAFDDDPIAKRPRGEIHPSSPRLIPPPHREDAVLT
ncbi:bifunctional DNA primase/polymerase [Rhodococcus erythropolis]|uniref:bifunctional DNA primase/polymerase n=1 Tax=Rhodococcus erythropolis TaxID=1833 RepID=UPI0018A25FDB|nr:bifunctional DNA primase/polymerase [Rhodococcus erythropolis]MBF7736699.1 bifunctional DNA primase/polymerase [Rhodococcus erythropolis]MCZ4644052.1 bifunctional DNA primase/polymerase [Rhodococcus erythropolis]